MNEIEKRKAMNKIKERIKWDKFKKTWESYGVSFQREDGTYKSTYEVLKEMSFVWNRLNEEEKSRLQEEEKRGTKEWNLFK